jgi:hypothetical protein
MERSRDRLDVAHAERNSARHGPEDDAASCSTGGRRAPTCAAGSLASARWCSGAADMCASPRATRNARDSAHDLKARHCGAPGGHRPGKRRSAVDLAAGEEAAGREMPRESALALRLLRARAEFCDEPGLVISA